MRMIKYVSQNANDKIPVNRMRMTKCGCKDADEKMRMIKYG